MRYLLRQGLALRGQTENEGNFLQLLKLLADDDSDLRLYMKRKTSFVSPQAQNEIEEMYCHTILKKLASNIQIFNAVVGGIHGITSAEQESICTRYVDTDLNVHETFIERYNIPYTTGDTISNMVFDVLMRLNLPLSGLRAQTYDGAANMSGAYNGCQAKVKEQQPLAIFFHCGAHMANLVNVMQQAVAACLPH